MALSKIPSYLQNEAALTSGDLPAGSVLQIIEANKKADGIFSTSSTSFVDVGLSATITPISSSSKILIHLNSGGVNRPGNSSECPRLQILRGSTKIYGGFNIFYTTDALEYSGVSTNFDLVDEPATTSATTYKVQMRTRLGNGCSMNAGDAGGSTDQYASLILTEIAG